MGRRPPPARPSLARLRAPVPTAPARPPGPPAAHSPTAPRRAPPARGRYTVSRGGGGPSPMRRRPAGILGPLAAPPPLGPHAQSNNTPPGQPRTPALVPPPPPVCLARSSSSSSCASSSFLLRFFSSPPPPPSPPPPLLRAPGGEGGRGDWGLGAAGRGAGSGPPSSTLILPLPSSDDAYKPALPDPALGRPDDATRAHVAPAGGSMPPPGAPRRPGAPAARAPRGPAREASGGPRARGEGVGWTSLPSASPSRGAGQDLLAQSVTKERITRSRRGGWDSTPSNPSQIPRYSLEGCGVWRPQPRRTPYKWTLHRGGRANKTRAEDLLLQFPPRSRGERRPITLLA